MTHNTVHKGQGKFWQFPRLGGILPSNLLFSVKRFVNIVKLSKEEGICPENLL
jgi:hypothetical protein